MAHNNRSPGTPRIFYGWILVAVLLLLLSVGMGTTMYMYSVVAAAVGGEYEAGRLTLMAGSTGMLLVMGLCSPWLGTLLDRYSSKGILITGAVLMGLGFLWIAFSTHVWMVVASYILLISAGAATMSTLTTATLLTRWFVRHRGLAIGVASLGTQFGGFFYPPLFAAAMETWDWRVAIGGLGVLVMVLAPLMVRLLVVDRPEDIHQAPCGGTPDDEARGAASGEAARPAARLSFPRLLRHRNFWLVVLIIGAGSATNTTLLANLSLFATDLGEPVVRGAFLVSLVSLLGVVFSPLLGWLSDVINVKVVVAIMTLSLAISCLIFSVATSYPVLLLAAFFQGIGGGGVFPVWASVVAHLYHHRVYGQVMGSTTLITATITAATPVFAGWIYDTTGTYRTLFLTLLAVLAVLTLCIVLIRVPGRLSEKFGATDEETVAVS